MKLRNQILYRACKSADFTNTHKNLLLAEQMLDFMTRNRAIGLAANQIGINLRLFVMQVGAQARHCFNPSITSSGPELAVMAEGCLSFPNKQCTISRPNEIDVAYQDHQGQWIRDRLTGLESRCYQHELDHLEGKTMWDRQKEQNAKQS